LVRKVLVTLSGTHGTGKSTNAGQCYYLLNRKGLRFSYLVHQDILDPFGFIVRRAARVLGLSENELQKRRPVRVLWSLYLLLVYLPILGGGIFLRRLLGNSTVCDRYIYDTMVGFRDYGVNIPVEGLLLRLVPRPDISFVLEAPEERILSNRPEHSAEFIRNEKRLYALVAEHFHLYRVSTAGSRASVWWTIVGKVESVMGGKPQASQTMMAEAVVR